MLKYPVQGKIISVHGEEEYMINHLNSFRYVELDGEFIETPFQHFEELSEEIAATKAVSSVLTITRPPTRMSSLKDARAVVEEGGSTIWGQLPDFPFKSEKIRLEVHLNCSEGRAPLLCRRATCEDQPLRG